MGRYSAKFFPPAILFAAVVFYTRRESRLFAPCQNNSDALFYCNDEIDMENDNNPYSASNVPPIPSARPQMPQDEMGDATGGIIPYKNPKALIAYYLGILSGLPLIGFPLGIAAFVLGIMGLRDRAKNPIIKGSVHAGIGIGCGGIFTLLWGAVIVTMIVAIATNPSR